MPSKKRHKTNYPGVYYIDGESKANGKKERIYYIYYRKNGRQIEEKAGRQYQDDMTPARASRIRALRINGDQQSNEEKRKEVRKRKTINDIWDEYKHQKKHLKGLIYDENRYQKHIKSTFGNKEPKDLNPIDVDKFRLSLIDSYKPATVRNILELLRRIINFGIKKKLCENIDLSIEMPIVNNVKTEDLTPKQLDKLLKAIDEDDDTQAANFMKLALYTGMRRGELFRLKWQHINFDRGFIRIIDPKGGQDQDIPLNTAAYELLSKHPHTASEYVFPGKKGNQRVDIKKSVERIRKRAELPKDFRPLHGLRHVYASMLASSGEVDLYTLQKLMTHKSPQMTQRYAHLRDDALKKASNVAAQYFTSNNKKDEN